MILPGLKKYLTLALLVLLVTYIMSVWPPLAHWYFKLHSVHNTSRTICMFGNIVAAQMISARPNIQRSVRAFCRFCEDCLHCPAMSVSGKGESTPWRPHRCNRGNAQYIPETWAGGGNMWAEGVSTFKRTKLWTILTWFVSIYKLIGYCSDLNTLPTDTETNFFSHK